MCYHKIGSLVGALHFGGVIKTIQGHFIVVSLKSYATCDWWRERCEGEGLDCEDAPGEVRGGTEGIASPTEIRRAWSSRVSSRLSCRVREMCEEARWGRRERGGV